MNSLKQQIQDHIDLLDRRMGDPSMEPFGSIVQAKSTALLALATLEAANVNNASGTRANSFTDKEKPSGKSWRRYEDSNPS